MSKRFDKDYLKDALEGATRVTDYCKNISFEQFLIDTKTQDAVVRNIEIIGEAVKNVSEGLKTQHAAIPWKSIAGMRDRLIHDYFGVNWDVVWNVVIKDIPDLTREIEKIISSL